MRFVEERSEEENAAKRAKKHECAEQQSSQPADDDEHVHMYLGNLVLSLEKLRLHRSGKLLPISLFAMINRRLTNLCTNVCYPWTMVQNVTLYCFIVEVQLVWQPISKQGT